MNAALLLFTAPYRWFANIIVLREKRRMMFPAVFGIICFVGFARAELEVLTTRMASFDANAIINNFAFYLQSAYLYALLATRLTGKSLHRVTGIVVIGVFLGVFPPILDVLIGGQNSGYYRYVEHGLSNWHWTLVNPRYYGPGEALTLWALVVVLALYVLQVTRSALRGVIALGLSYAAVTFIAVGPSSLVAAAVPHAAPFAPPTRLTALTLLQLVLAQAAYLAIRIPVAKRLARRLPHAMPFVALTLLGSSVAELFSPSGLTAEERLTFTGVTAVLMLQLCIVALVQNDAYDVQKDQARTPSVTVDDAHFFTMVGVLSVLTVSLVLPGLGMPMALFLCVSTLYSYDFYRGQRYFPANYKSEGVWGWSAFVLGGSAGLSVARVRAISPGFLLASLFVFGGWSLFNAFKDYKDVRADYKVGNQTLYVLAKKRGVRLRGLHRGLRDALMVAMTLPLLALGGVGVGWGALIPVTAASAGFLYWALGGPPNRTTVLRFLWGIAGYVLALAAAIEWSLRSR